MKTVLQIVVKWLPVIWWIAAIIMVLLDNSTLAMAFAVIGFLSAMGSHDGAVNFIGYILAFIAFGIAVIRLLYLAEGVDPQSWNNIWR